MPTSAVIEAIAVTAELCGRTFSPAAAMVFASDLDGYEESAVLSALTRCRKEVKGLLTLQDVVSRLDDGRPGADEAWAMLPVDEAQTTVWTDEIAEAWGIARQLLLAKDKAGAYRAFKETYTAAVNKARNEKRRPKWTASLGDDKYGRESVLMEAVQKGRLSAPHVRAILPYHEISQPMEALLGRVELKLISNRG